MEEYQIQRTIKDRDAIRSDREFERRKVTETQQRQLNKSRYVLAVQKRPIEVIYEGTRYYDPVWARRDHEWIIQVGQGKKSFKGILAKVDNESRTLDIILANGTELKLGFDPEGAEPDLLK